MARMEAGRQYIRTNLFVTFLDVLPQYRYILVPIRAGLLVPEPDGVHELVKYDPFTVTAITYGEFLCTRHTILSTNNGITSKPRQNKIKYFFARARFLPDAEMQIHRN